MIAALAQNGKSKTPSQTPFLQGAGRRFRKQRHAAAGARRVACPSQAIAAQMQKMGM